MASPPRLSLILLLVACLVSLSVVALAGEAPTLLLRIPSATDEALAALRGLVSQDDLRPLPDGSYHVFLSASLLDQISPVVDYEVLEKSRPLRQKVADADLGADLPDGYLDLDGIWDRLSSLVRDNPNILRFVNLTSFGPGRTFEGREMLMVKLSDNVAVIEDEPNVLILASHHAREIVNPHIVLDLLQRLVDGYNRNDTRLRKIVEENEIFLSPLWNPDGYYHVWEVDNMWRKNRKPQ